MGSTHAMQLVVAIIFLVANLSSSFIAGQTKTSSNSSELGTNLLDVNNGSQIIRVSDDTVRVDPLDGFKKYRGGYNITNKHYWSSTVFTGVYGYVIGIIWLLGGITYGIFLLMTTFCCKNRSRKLEKKSSWHKQYYLWPILIAIFFTILAITASGLVLGGNAKFHSRANTVINIVIETANDASVTMYNTTGAMREIRNELGVYNNQSNKQASAFLTSTSEKLDAEAADIQRQARKNRRLIDRGIKIVYIVTTVTISLNLAAVIALLVCGTLRLRRALNMLIVLCWFLTALCWLCFGLYFFLEKFSSDTCTALENFQQNPYNNSLSSVLPCDDLLSAKPVLADVSKGIYNLVNEVNANLSVIQGSNPSAYYVCNPFSAPPEYQYQPDSCPANTIRIKDIPQALKIFTCSDSNNGTCSSGQVISANDYKAAEAFSTSIQSLLDVYPGMENLVECQSVKDAFSEILSRHCKPLKKYAHMVWASLVFLSLVMVFLVVVWTMQSHQEQEHHSSDGSVKPNDEVKSAKAEVIKDSPQHTSV